MHVMSDDLLPNISLLPSAPSLVASFVIDNDRHPDLSDHTTSYRHPPFLWLPADTLQLSSWSPSCQPTHLRTPETTRRNRHLDRRTAMPTDLPYAADAQESLAYDELEVRLVSTTHLLRLAAVISRLSSRMGWSKDVLSE
jgi:hypothetical protein